MLQNYFKIALRALKGQKAYSFINIGGLALGLACCFLVVLFMQHELSFDQFHPNKDQTFRVVRGFTGSSSVNANTSSGYAVALKAEFPEVAAAVRFEGGRSPYIEVENERRQVRDFAYADANFFSFFGFALTEGNPETALEAPRTLVVSERVVERYFGGASPVGQTVIIGQETEMTITGVMANVPANSHLQFDWVASFNTYNEAARNDFTNYNYFTYVQLQPNTNPKALEQKMRNWVVERFGAEASSMPLLQPLTKIHFTTGYHFDVSTNRDIRYVYAFAFVGLLILMIACINFMNLATARATRRAREVGVRKVLGANRAQIIRQFMGESVLMSALALVIAFGLASLLLPIFNTVVGSSATLSFSWLTALLLVVIGLLAGVLAGSYPALYLAAFQPARVLKGEVTRGRAAARLRQGLIVVQFAISAFLVISTLTVFTQLQFMQSQQLGFEKEQIVFASMPASIRQNFETFRQQLMEDPRVLDVTHANGLPGRAFNNRGYNWPGDNPEEEQGMGLYTIIADPYFINTMGLEVVEGRNFSLDIPTDATQAYIVNETAVAQLGFENPIGQPFRVWDREEMGQIVGVVKDFHFKSLHQSVEPVVLNLSPNWQWLVAIRMAPGSYAETLAAIEAKWKAMAPAYIFDYTFLDEDFDRLYKDDQQAMQRFGFFASIAILIACLGLLGLAAYMAEQRTKEIGIRKVLGANVSSLLVLFSSDFLKLVLVAFLLGVPAAYYFMQTWLAGFAYSAGFSWLGVLAAGMAMVFITLATVSYQALKAALAKPIKSLRYE